MIRTDQKDGVPSAGEGDSGSPGDRCGMRTWLESAKLIESKFGYTTE